QLAACQRALPGGARVPVCKQTATAGPPDVEKPRTRPLNLRFRFPDTEVVGITDEDVTLTGPALIAGTHRGDPLPCGIVAGGCSAAPGIPACIDQLLADGTCANVPDPQFPNFTALPPANNFAALCTDPAFPVGPCTGFANHTARL